MAEKQTTFEILYQKDVSENVEKKMGLSYLSWAWAHAEMKKVDEEAKIVIHEFPHYVQVGDTVQTVNKPFLNDEGGTWVKVSVTLKGRTETEWLPVMDYRNKAMPKPDAMSINKAHKRCFVKALALHGLGLYIYAGEDLPEKSDGEKNEASPNKNNQKNTKELTKTEEEIMNILNQLEQAGENRTAIQKQYLTDENESNFKNHKKMLAYFKKKLAEKQSGDAEQESLLDRYGNPKE